MKLKNIVKIDTKEINSLRIRFSITSQNSHFRCSELGYVYIKRSPKFVKYFMDHRPRDTYPIKVRYHITLISLRSFLTVKPPIICKIPKIERKPSMQYFASLFRVVNSAIRNQIITTKALVTNSF